MEEKMAKKKLVPVIRIIEDKCINCGACITACPVKLCMDGSGEKLQINHDLCIGCGNCIVICTHEARDIIDDSAQFFNDLKSGTKMVAVVAPAIASFLPDEYMNFNGWLKSLGVAAVFDVSFGAEITVVSYLDHIKTNNPKTVIAQPCPAIANYIQIYAPKLIPFLAPADSPMLHTIKMLREYFPQYKDHKVAVISPCVAKKREFDETGLGDYNVTMLYLKRYLESHKIELGSFSPEEYFGPKAERAVGFSTPGGLLDTAERFSPGIRRHTLKLEGAHNIYPYLKEMSEILNSNVEFAKLIDCLNCEKGCNGGPGTGNSKKPMAVLEYPIAKRSSKLEKNINVKKYNKMLNNYWKKNLYKREYLDLSGNYTLKKPNVSELDEVYRRLKKNDKKDIYNCTACGYGSCELMAVAVYNNLNKPSNCLHYILARLKEEMAVEELNKQLKEHIGQASVLIEGINKLIHELDATIGMQAAAADESSVKTEKMINSLVNLSDISKKEQDSIQELIEDTAQGQEAMRITIQSIQSVSESVDGIATAIQVISSIAANTNLLSMNAAIQAAHAGDAGRGFAVVANEIRRLSESTRENSTSISQTLKSIIEGISVTSKQSDVTDGRINQMSVEINSFAQTISELIRTLNELSLESSEISGTLDALRDKSTAVKSGYSEILQMTDKLELSMQELKTLANRDIHQTE
jgi:iron only hydrogenase large subunit-like protein